MNQPKFLGQRFVWKSEFQNFAGRVLLVDKEPKAEALEQTFEQADEAVVLALTHVHVETVLFKVHSKVNRFSMPEASEQKLVHLI